MSSSSFLAILAAWSTTLSFSLVGFVGTCITADVFDLVGVWNKDVGLDTTAVVVVKLLPFLVPDDDDDAIAVLGDSGRMDLDESRVLLLLLLFVDAVFLLLSAPSPALPPPSLPAIAPWSIAVVV